MAPTDRISLQSLLAAISENISTEDLLLSGLQADIATTITSRRIASGMSQKELADMLNVTQSMVSRWERGETNFTLQTLVKIAQKLSISMQSPFVPDMPAHYHYIANVTPFPGPSGWSSASYSPAAYQSNEELKEM